MLKANALTWYLGSMNSTELGKYSSSELARLSHEYVGVCGDPIG